jgi:Uma2 family endonuclease
MSADEFLDWIEKQSEPYELVDGMPLRMMAGAKQSHNVATSNIVVALAPSAKTKGCRTTSGDTAVRTGQYGVRYPDVVVDCGPPDPSAKEATQPTVVVEVSSPGTLAIDVTDKLDEYQAHDDIQVIILVEPDVISVKVYRRDMHGLWSVEKYDDLGQVIQLPEVNSSIALRDVYDTLEPKARPRLHVVQKPESKPKS